MRLWVALALLSIPAAAGAQAPAPVPVIAAPANSLAAPPVAAPRVPDPLDAAPPDFGAESEGMGWQLAKTAVVLGIVLLTVYITLNFGLRRLMGLKGGPFGRAAVLKVVERLPLDPKRSLFLVQAAGEYLLVGGGDGGMTLLSKLNPEEVERLLQDRAAAPVLMTPFLQKLLSRRSGPPPGPQGSST